MAGDGDVPSALTDQRDVGRFVARVIRDPRTINRFILAHGELWTPNQIYQLLDELSGGEVRRAFVSEEKLRDRVRQAAAVLRANPDDKSALWTKVNGEIQISVEIEGHNTPEKAAELGYLVAKDLYPDWTSRRFADLVEETLRGQGKQLYASNEKMQTFRDVV